MQGGVCGVGGKPHMREAWGESESKPAVRLAHGERQEGVGREEGACCPVDR